LHEISKQTPAITVMIFFIKLVLDLGEFFNKVANY